MAKCHAKTLLKYMRCRNLSHEVWKLFRGLALRKGDARQNVLIVNGLQKLTVAKARGVYKKCSWLIVMGARGDVALIGCTRYRNTVSGKASTE